MSKYVELPKEHITFYGDTEEEKKKNETIFDLSLEIDRLWQENKELKKKITFNEKCRRKMEQSLMKQIEQSKKERKTLYKYTPEKGFRLVGDEE